MNSDLRVPSRDEDEESTISAGTSELDLKLSSSDDEEQDLDSESRATVSSGSKAPEQSGACMLKGRKPVIKSVVGCEKYQGHLVYLVRERFRKEPIVVPASYVNKNFPQLAIRYYESLVYDQVDKEKQ